MREVSVEKRQSALKAIQDKLTGDKGLVAKAIDIASELDSALSEGKISDKEKVKAAKATVKQAKAVAAALEKPRTRSSLPRPR